MADRTASWIVLTAAVLALALGFWRLGAPSIWHDEAVHVVVAKSISDTGYPYLPSGRLHPVAPVYNYLLAGFIRLFGDGEWAVRAPSVLLSALNVVLLFWVLRPLLGAPAAALAALGLALSPWSVAWARQARFYTCQQTLYLLAMGLGWRFVDATSFRAQALHGAGAAGAYAAGLATSLHSILALGPVAAYAGLMGLVRREGRFRQFAVAALAGCIGILTLVAYRTLLPQPDADAIFKEGRWFSVGGWTYYVAWLWGNLGTGFFALALLGTGLMLWREGRRGLYAGLAFWAPVLCLSILLGYRIHRFIFFVYPFYVALWAYALVVLAQFMATWRQSRWRMAAAALLVVFLLRLGLSEAGLLRATLATASGSDTTLATRHPQWRKPCDYVKAALRPGDVLITTTFMPVYYYVGRVDNWYPNRYLIWETAETGQAGLKDLAELQAYVAAHPKGYFLAEWFRFWHFDLTAEELAWVDKNMTLLKEASSGDVRVYRWGYNPENGEPLP